MRKAVVASIVALLVLVAPAGAQAGKRFWAVHLEERGPLTSQDADVVRGANAGTARLFLWWRNIHPTQGSGYNWSVPDHQIGLLASRGVQVLPVLYGSPNYAQAGGNCPSTGCYPGSRPPLGTAQAQADWKDFLTRAVQRYGPGGTFWSSFSGQPVPITAWQVWNEVNLPRFFTTSNPVGDYAHLLKLSHQAIKGANSHAKVVLSGMPGVLSAGTSGNSTIHSWGFLDHLYRKPGVKRSFEIGALHPYAPNQRLVALQANKYRKAMKKHGDGRTPIYFTEFAWGSGPPDSTGLNKGLAGQAKALSQSFRMFWKNRRAWRLKKVVWYDLRDPAPGAGSCGGNTFCNTSGLVTNNYTKKPGYNAFANFAAHH